MIDALIQEFEQEAKNTRRVLEALPESGWHYKPDERSMSMGKLASHLVDINHWTIPTAQEDVFQMTGDWKPFEASTKEELLTGFDNAVPAAVEALRTVSDEKYMATWKMLGPDGAVVLEMPKAAVLRAFIMSHAIHHRGQLEVYIRANGGALPGIYGPSADEQ
jgi:uncharacterized damage-inducible protein DinB